MPIKDIIVPSFVGTSTVEFIVTRGFSGQNPTIQYYVNCNQLVGNIATEELFRKAVALTGYTFSLTKKSDGSAVTSGSVTTKITKDGGTQGNTSASAVHEGNGQWSINLSSDEMDADIIGLSFTHADAIANHITLKTHG
tara:strand:+ start:1925 stop:2341 length:417 start_codon:yes stop_codon:yes gene_type:complete